jgi:hypothetical protein
MIWVPKKKQNASPYASSISTKGKYYRNTDLDSDAAGGVGDYVNVMAV